MFTIRSAQLDDLDEVVGLWGRAAGPTRRAGQRKEAEVLLEHSPDALLVAQVDGQLVGTLIVGWDGWRCHLYRLAVDPAFRRRGVGRALLKLAMSRALNVGATRVDAMVDRDNLTGIAFWESEGFEFDTADSRWSLLLGPLAR